MWTADVVPLIVLYAILLGVEAALTSGRRSRRGGRRRSADHSEDEHFFTLLCEACVQAIQEKAPWLIALWHGLFWLATLGVLGWLAYSLFC